MVVAVSIVMQKVSGSRISQHARLAVIQDAATVEEAKGVAVTMALHDEDEYLVASLCASEVTLPPKGNAEESAELSHNSRYATALRVYEEWGEAKFCSDQVNFAQFCNKRLNAQKDAHCA